MGDVARQLSPSHSSVSGTAGWCSAAEPGRSSAESGCSLWIRSSEYETPAMALRGWHREFVNTAGYSEHWRVLTPSSPPLTVMRGGDVDTFTGRFLATEVRHPVECLDRKDVSGVRQQAPHLQPAMQQAVLCRPVADTFSAGQARPLG